ncbi:MAG: hypothetical protein V4639_14975 [Pseudomonadota bacterium]
MDGLALMQGFERSAKAQAVKTTRISWVQLENSTTDGLLAKLCKWLNFIATDALAMVLLQALVTVVAASGMAFWSCGVGSGGACKALPGMPAAPFPYREVDFFKEDRQQGIPNPLRVTGPSKNIERGGFIGKSTTPPTRCHNAGTSDGDVDECIDHNIADSTQFFESKALVNSSKWRFVSTAAVYKAIRRQDGLLSPRFTR